VQKISQKYIKTIVKQALREDLRPSGDITTKFLKNRKKQVIAKIISGQNAIIGGLNFTKEAFKLSDKKIAFQAKIKDGKKVRKNKVVAILKGSALGILKSERVALNFLGLISGVATITNKFVKKVKGKSCKICCTRKTFPNLRLMQKYGVKLGGGINHRFNLSDEILIKDNHISADQNIRELVKKAIKNKKGKKVTVEVDNLSQLKKIIDLKFSRLLFDNMSPKNLRKGVRMSKRFYETEASGGVTLKNVRKIAGTGVKRISIGQITHSAPSINFKLDFIS
jgi:nicotinate-nucleotide pyrophosphorylase (carboxylating)